MKLRTLLLPLALLCATTASADLFKDPYGAVLGSYVNVDKDQGKTNGVGGGLLVGASLAKRFNLEFSGFYNKVGGDGLGVTGLDGQLMISNGKAATFLLAGGGYDFDNFSGQGGSHSSPYADIGAGIIGRISKHLAIRGEGRYYFLFNVNDNTEGDKSFLGDFRFNLGLQYAIGTVIPATELKKAPVVTAAAEVVDTDGDGVPDTLDQCPGTPFGVTVDAKGCPVVVDGDSDGDGVPDSVDKCPGTLKGFKVDAVGCIVEQTVILRAVNFDFGSDKLTSGARSTLDQLAESLKTQPGLELQIAGHTDSLGPAGFNLTLSQKRANAVKTYLVAHGIDTKRLKSEGYGEFNPIATNETEEGRAQNRRVEFKVLDKSAPPATSITLPVPADAPAK